MTDPVALLRAFALRALRILPVKMSLSVLAARHAMTRLPETPSTAVAVAEENIPMRSFQSILYVTNATLQERQALAQALSLARNNSTTLHVLVVWPEPPPTLLAYKDKFESFLTEVVRSAIREAQALLKVGSDDPPIRIDIDSADMPAIHIVRRVLLSQHDLVIKEADVSNGVEGFRALDMQLLRQCPCPLWLSRPIVRSPGEIQVAVAIDPRCQEPQAHDIAIRLLRLSRSLADMSNGRLLVVSCWEHEFEDYLRHQPWFRVSEDELDADVAATERDHRAGLDALLRESGIQGDIQVHHVRGRPEQLIPRVVEDAAVDILVMGTVARTGVPGFVIGNTAENVLRALKCSVLAVKPSGFVSAVKAY